MSVWAAENTNIKADALGRLYTRPAHQKEKSISSIFAASWFCSERLPCNEERENSNT